MKPATPMLRRQSSLNAERSARPGCPRSAARILEIDAARSRKLARRLSSAGYDTVRDADVSVLIRTIRLTPPDLVVVGSVGGDPAEALAVVRAIRKLGPIPVVLVVEEGSEALAVAALRAGASDYLKWAEVGDGLGAALARIRRRPASGRVQRRGDAGLVDGHRLLGDSAAMRRVRRQIQRAAGTDSNLLVTGETGTGKELVAELVHRNSSRRRGPFVAVNCAAIPESLLESELFGHERGAFTSADRRQAGKLEAAAGGTLLLDEIGDLSACAQAKVLRAVELKEVQRLGGGRGIPVDVRIITATHRALDRLMAEGRFRQDLYFRLDVARIDMAPLRDRKEDLYPLCEHLLERLSQCLDAEVKGFTLDAFNCLFWHSWPGNVRELNNVLEATFVNGPGDYITVGDLPEAFLRRCRSASSMPSGERDRVLWALHTCEGNKSEAARRLHWSRMTLYRKLDRYRIMVPRA